MTQEEKKYAKDMHKKAIVKYAKKNKGEFSHASSDVTPVGYGPHGESVESFSKDEKKLLDFIEKSGILVVWQEEKQKEQGVSCK